MSMLDMPTSDVDQHLNMNIWKTNLCTQNPIFSCSHNVEIYNHVVVVLLKRKFDFLELFFV